MATHQLLSISVLLSSLFSGALCTTFTLTNYCAYTVWPGLLSSAGTPALATTGFALAPGESRALDAPGAWSGRIWGRTLCAAGQTSGRFACATGDCGSGTVECAGGGAAPPTTLAEFTLAGAGGNDFYDVSLVDGSNLPMVVVPQGGAGASCVATGCLVDLNGPCPANLKVAGDDGAGIACKSACEAFGRPEDCCSGAYSSPATCQPSAYSQFFKNACPRAYSYAYDDATSTFTCTSGTANYLVVFCPSISSLKSSVGGTNPSPGMPLTNDTASFLGRGGYASSRASWPAPSPLAHLAAIVHSFSRGSAAPGATGSCCRASPRHRPARPLAARVRRCLRAAMHRPEAPLVQPCRRPCIHHVPARHFDLGP